MRIISGIAKGKRIHLPVDKKTRPLKDMVKESIFNILRHSDMLSKNLIDCIVLDLFSGVGSFGLEAISRGVEKVIFFEEYDPAVNLLVKNLKNLSFETKAEIKKKNIYDKNCFKNLNYNFDLVFLDPPFKDKKIMLLLNTLAKSSVVNSDTVIIIHRNKKILDVFDKTFKIIREEKYSSSKIIFGIFNF